MMLLFLESHGFTQGWQQMSSEEGVPFNKQSACF